MKKWQKLRKSSSQPTTATTYQLLGPRSDMLAVKKPKFKFTHLLLIVDLLKCPLAPPSQRCLRVASSTNCMRNTVVSFADLHIKSNLFPTLPSETLSQSCEKLPLATMTLFSNATYLTVFGNHTKSRIQHCERSELRLHFEWPKINENCQKYLFL